MRAYIFYTLGYDPKITNFDQSPYYANETGAQDKLTLAVKGENVPIVEGKSAAHSRWTVCLSCTSNKELIQSRHPFCEAMFKAAEGGPKFEEIQKEYRRCGYPRWFSATTAPKGSYRECDIVAMLDKHLPPKEPGMAKKHPKDWKDRKVEILLSDDYVAHKTMNVKKKCWEHGVWSLNLGGA